MSHHILVCREVRVITIIGIRAIDRERLRTCSRRIIAQHSAIGAYTPTHEATRALSRYGYVDAEKEKRGVRYEANKDGEMKVESR